MKRLTSEERIKLCQILHNNKYDYSKANFSNVKEKTTVMCPIHGEFKITFDNHYYSKNGCKFCKKDVFDNKTFIKKANAVHNNKYDYSKSYYINSHTKVIIICPIHGEFEQTPNAHIRGQGCPNCKVNSKLENIVETLLIENNIPFIKQKKFQWLGNMSLDFYITDLNVAIECQGKQHFNQGGWTKNFDFEKQIQRDKNKFNLCKQNNINIIYFAEIKQNKPYFSKIFYEKSELLKTIRYLYINKENN